MKENLLRVSIPEALWVHLISNTCEPAPTVEVSMFNPLYGSPKGEICNNDQNAYTLYYLHGTNGFPSTRQVQVLSLGVKLALHITDN